MLVNYRANGSEYSALDYRVDLIPAEKGVLELVPSGSAGLGMAGLLRGTEVHDTLQGMVGRERSLPVRMGLAY